MSAHFRLVFGRIVDLMRPLVVILGITLGSLASIAFSLAGVLFVFWILQSENARFEAELPELFRSTLVFLVLALIAASAFIGVIKLKPWRNASMAALAVGLAITGWYYWPA